MTVTKKDRRNYMAFIMEYKELMDKYGLYIASYDDCGAPWVLELDYTGWETTSQKQADHLIKAIAL